MTILTTRDQAVELLRKLSWNVDELGPEERESIRRLFALDDYRTVAEAMEETNAQRGNC